jgi:hypothetical protein
MMMEESKHKLVELHREKDKVEWYVSGLRKGMQGSKDERVTLKVHCGLKPVSDFLPVNNCPSPLYNLGAAE